MSDGSSSSIPARDSAVADVSSTDDDDLLDGAGPDPKTESSDSQVTNPTTESADKTDHTVDTPSRVTEQSETSETEHRTNVIAISEPGDEPLPKSTDLSIPSKPATPVEHTSFPYIMARNDSTDGRNQKNMRLREDTLSAIQDTAHVMMNKRYPDTNLSEFDIQEAIILAGLWNLDDVDAALQQLGAGINAND